MTWFFRIAFWGGLLFFLLLLMSAHPENALISWILYFAFYYGNRWWMRFTLRRKKFKLYFFTVILVILFIGTIACTLLIDSGSKISEAQNSFFDELLKGSSDSSRQMIDSGAAAIAIFFLYFSHYIFLSLMQMVNFQVTVVKDWFHGAHMDDKLEHTTDKLLKTELNPHLFKNMLNNIYTLVLLKKDEAAIAIEKLKSFMEYMLYGSNDKRVALSKEIEYISDLIEIEKFRLPENFKLSFKISGNPDGKFIAPLILLPFIENVFRHGDLSSEQAFIDISIKIKSNHLEYAVKNNIPVRKSDTHEYKGGKGLSNLKSRLEITYRGFLGSNYILKTEPNGSTYNACLELLDLEKPENQGA